MINRRSREDLLISKLGESGIQVFSLDKVSQLLKTNAATSSQVVHQLAVDGRIRRIQKARYLVVPQGHDPKNYTLEANLIASELIRPYYLSYWTALHYYGWTEQPSNTIFIATTKLKHAIKVSGVTFKFIKLKPSRFCGYRKCKVDGHQVIVASPEKAIVDCLDQPRYCGEIVEAAKGIWFGRNELDFDKIRRYARRMGNGAIIKRLGFLMEILGVGTEVFREKLKAEKSSGYAALDTDGKTNGTFNSAWNLIVNVSQHNLTEWIRH
jgi:predicted transcriptional regulator of viral defense system